ncbi:MAG: efflux RND transporter permease subunit, partial [Myxococcales bacterium]|nr:efflux RND transporter permease subunit [Myxococcales bacterium]
MIDLAVRRPVATAGIYIALLALGAYSFRLIPIELLPDVDYPRLTLTASWSGASPEAMEAFVTAPLEAAAQQVQDARKITSRTRTNRQGTGSVAEIEIEFIRDARMEFAELELRERVATLRDELPPGVQPTVIPYVPPEFSEEAGGFLTFQLRGPYTFGYLAEMADESIKQRLLAIDGVSAVNVRGAEGRELLIELDPQRLEAHGLTAAEVQLRIAELETLVAPGSVLLEGQQVALSVRTRADEVADLRDLVVDPVPDNPVRLADVGRVRDRTADPTMYFRIDGLPTVTLDVTKQPRVNSVRVADRVKEEATALAPDLPAGTTLEVDIDQSKDIRSQLTDLRLRAMAAGIVIFLVLILFMRSLGSALVIFATIGFSVLIAINFLYLGGFSLNVLTLAGLAWGFGLVVDNSIVVLENVERHRARGKSAIRAAREGARQVVLPVLAATATTAIVLVPFLFLQGDLRVYYLPLAFAVGFSIVASLFVAFSFVPTMTARFGRSAPPEPVATASLGENATSSGEAATRVEPAYIRGYRSLLRGALAHPFLVALVCLGALAGSWYLFDEHVNKNVRWASFWGQQTYISIYIEFPRGAGLDRTDELARSFEGRLSQIAEVDRFETTVMDQYAFIRVTFPEELENSAVPPAIKEQMVAYSHQFTGARVRVFGYGPSFYGGGSSPPNYTIRIFGYNYLKVKEIAEDMASRLERFGRIRDVDPNAGQRWFERDKEFEYFLAVDR